MNLRNLKPKSVNILTLLIIFFCFSCGEDFTDDYNKLKKEYDELAKAKTELEQKNADLDALSIEMVKNTQGDMISNFVTSILQTIRSNNFFNSTFQNIYENNKLVKTIVRQYSYSPKIAKNYNPSFPIMTETYVHTTNDRGIITQSKSENVTIDFGWNNGDCVDIIVTEDGYISKYNLNKDGQITSLKLSNYEYSFTYNENNDLIERKKVYTKDETITEQETYEYNDKNELKKITYLDYGTLTMIDEFSDEGDIYISKKTRYMYGDVKYVTIKKYNKKGRIIYLNRKDQREELISSVEYIDDKLWKHTYEECKYEEGKKVSGSKTVISDIDEGEHETSTLNMDSRRIRIMEKYLKSLTYKYYNFEEVDGTFKYVHKDHYTSEYFGKEKNHQPKNQIKYTTSGEKKVETIYSNYYDIMPFAPKTKVVNTYTDNAITEVKEYTNDQNVKDSDDIEWTLKTDE